MHLFGTTTKKYLKLHLVKTLYVLTFYLFIFRHQLGDFGAKKNVQVPYIQFI